MCLFLGEQSCVDYLIRQSSIARMDNGLKIIRFSFQHYFETA
jgi:hypothetical protein